MTSYKDYFDSDEHMPTKFTIRADKNSRVVAIHDGHRSNGYWRRFRLQNSQEDPVLEGPKDMRGNVLTDSSMLSMVMDALYRGLEVKVE
jgi:hypothetical protein